MLHIFFAGLVLGLGLIISIGMQNAYVIRQGVRREHAYVVALTCALCDSLLILLSLTGFARAITAWPLFNKALLFAAVGFLSIYGSLALYKAVRRSNDNSPQNISWGEKQTTLLAVLITAISFSWLNPQALLEMVVIIGGLANKYTLHSQYFFIAGLIAASFIWFFSLSFCSIRLSTYLHSARAWRILDGLSGALMLGIAGYFLFLA